MNSFNPFSLRYHNRDGGTSAAPIRRVPFGDDGADVQRGDPFGLSGGVLQAYEPSQGVFGVAMYDHPDYQASPDEGAGNTMLSYPIKGENIAFRVQAKNLDASEEAQAITAAVLGETFDMAGDPGEMWLDCSDDTGTDWLVIDIESTFSEWGDLYPILIVKCANPQLTITT